MDKIEKLNRIKAALKFSERGLAFLDLATCDDDIFSRLEDIGQGLCAELIPGDSSFYLVDSVKKQAGTIHELSTVVVFKGMLNFIFRAASLAAAVTPCPTPAPTGAALPWAQNVARWLEEGEFCFDDERNWWLQSSDHRSIFDFYAENIFRFVVLHEIGHLHNMHGARREEPTSRQSFAPPPGLSDGDKNGSIAPEIVNHGASTANAELSTHVRETVADTYAFQFFLHDLIESLTDEDDGAENSKDTANAGTFASIVIALNFVQLYFWLSDAMPSTKTDFTLNEQKYPPYAFRMQVIESVLLEHGSFFLPAALIREGLRQAIEKTLTISKSVAGAEDFITWRTKLNDPLFFEHYAKICQSVPGWANGVFGKYD